MAVLALALAGAAPVEREVADGVVDWSARRIRVTGVGTPRIASPTAALTGRDLYEAARDDARARLQRALADLPLDDERRLADVPPLEPRRQIALQGFTSGDALHFADGTVHLPATLSFAWLAEALAAVSAEGAPPEVGPPPPPSAPADASPTDAGALAPTAAGPSGLVVVVRGAVQPAVRVRLESHDGGRFVRAGLRGDPVGAAGVAWVTARADGAGFAGATPLVVGASAPAGGRPGVLRLRKADSARLFGSDGAPRIAGGVVVVTR